ncbi:hypothetical protein ACFWAT_14380 [Streptomyces syringium]|uniref:hypothetical protein n=1 Tax=Streptomyces syringium TaxID=76729 RepID=UPI00365B7BE4
MQPRAVILGEHLPRLEPRLAPRQSGPPLLLLPLLTPQQNGCGGVVERDRVRASLGLRRALVGRPAVDDDLGRRRDARGGEVDSRPVLPDSLASPQPPVPHEVKNRVVQLVVGLGSVEVLPVLLRGPHHDGTRDDSGLTPLLHPGVGPQHRLGTGRRGEFDVLRRVESDHLLHNRPIQGGAQCAPDALDGGGPSDLPERRHLGELGLLGGDPLTLGGQRPAGLGRLAAGELLASGTVLGGDDLGLILDRVEQLGHVAHAEPVVDDQVPAVRFEVHTDVRFVSVPGCGAQRLAGAHVLVEQLGECDRLGKAAFGPYSALDLSDGRDLGFLGVDLGEQVAER